MRNSALRTDGWKISSSHKKSEPSRGRQTLAKTEERFAKSLDELTKTFDKFLKPDIEEEFTFMKEDLKRVKAVLREKLGVSLD
jgi:hypothetical protein